MTRSTRTRRGLGRHAAAMATAALVTLPVAAQWVDPVQTPVRTTQQHGQRVIPADMDGDADLDLICSYSLTDEVVLELNGGDGTSWQMVQVGADIPATIAAPARVDGDADLDIVAVGLFDRATGFNTEGFVRWYERAGPIDQPGSWLQHDIDLTMVHPRHLDLGDVDGDLDVDVAVVSNGVHQDGSGFGNAAVWYENLGGGASWQRHVVATGLASPMSIRLVELAGGGFPELVVAEYGGDRVLWFDCGADPEGAWTLHEISTTVAGPTSARPYDMDDDGDQDVLAAFHTAGQVSWFERPPDPANDPWPSHAVAASLPCAVDVARGDLTGDGLADVASGSSDWSGTCVSDTFTVLESDGAGGWVEHAMPYYSFTAVEVGDVDGDSDLDSLTASYNGSRVDWWENASAGDPVVFGDGFEAGDLLAWSSASP